MSVICAAICMAKTTASHRNTLLKYVHGWNLRTERSNFEQPTCQCGKKESTLHLVDCLHNQQLFHEFVIKLDSKLKQYRTHRPLREVFMSHIRNLRAQPWGPRNLLLRKVENEQKELGRWSVWNGMVSQTWGDIQEAVYRERGEKKEITGGSWVQMVLREIFGFVDLLWKRRNERTHNTPIPDEREKLSEKIRKLQLKKLYVSGKLRKMYRTSISEITDKRKPLSHLRRWIRIFTSCEKMEEHLLRKRPKHTSLITNHIDVKIPDINMRYENQHVRINNDFSQDMEVEENEEPTYKRQMTLGHYYQEAKRRRIH